MTRTKAKRLIDEMIAKYGDVVVAKTYDYWKSKTYANEVEDTNTVISEIHLSEIEPPINRVEYKKLEDIVNGKEEITYIPIEVPESKAVYNSPEQAELRKVHKDNTRKRLLNIAPFCMPPDRWILHNKYY